MNNEYYDYEDRRYVNPTTSRDEQLGFIDNLRNTQAQDLASISRDTYNLGTRVPSSMGGLSGSGNLWNRQYVSPQVNSMVEGLRSTAQAQALNTAMSNYQSQLNKRYQDAYKAASKRRGSGGGGSGGGTTGTTDDDYESLYDYLRNQGLEVDKREVKPGGEWDNLSDAFKGGIEDTLVKIIESIDNYGRRSN